MENLSLIIILLATAGWVIWLFIPGARQDWIIAVAYLLCSTAWFIAGL